MYICCLAFFLAKQLYIIFEFMLLFKEVFRLVMKLKVFQALIPTNSGGREG